MSNPFFGLFRSANIYITFLRLFEKNESENDREIDLKILRLVESVYIYVYIFIFVRVSNAALKSENFFLGYI